MTHLVYTHYFTNNICILCYISYECNNIKDINNYNKYNYFHQIMNFARAENDAFFLQKYAVLDDLILI